jgi:GTPase SAR1 family protein
VTNRQTFLDLRDWIKELKDKTQTDTIIHVVGSKADLKASANGEAIE